MLMISHLQRFMITSLQVQALVGRGLDMFNYKEEIGTCMHAVLKCLSNYYNYIHREILLSNSDWLNDNIINAIQILLNEKYSVPGLQNTLLGNANSFDVMGSSEFVQVMNANDHWIAVSTIGCQYSHIKVYDSLYHDMPTRTKDQICSLLGCTESSIKLDYVNVQLQSNSSDCGLFSLAFTTALCAGIIL